MNTPTDEYHTIESSVMGVYVVTHLESGRQYVGKAFNIRNRWQSHVSALHRGERRGTLWGEDWERSGQSGFRFNVLVSIRPDEIGRGDTAGHRLPAVLLQVEKLMIAQMAPIYNANPYEVAEQTALKRKAARATRPQRVTRVGWEQLVYAKRCEMNISQQELASMLDCSPAWVCRTETGKAPMTIGRDLAQKLHHTLGIPLDLLPYMGWRKGREAPAPDQAGMG